MKRIQVLLFIIFWASAAFCADQIVDVATLEWPPYSGEKLKNYGFASEIVATAFEKAGYKIRFHFMPWARAVQQVELGHYHALHNAYYSAERAKTFLISIPYANSVLGFYKRVGQTIKFRSLLDLKPYIIGVTRGYVNTAEFDNADFLIKDLANNDYLSLLKLFKGRVDLAVMDKYVGQYLVVTQIPKAIGKLEFMEPAMENKPLHLCFSRNKKGFEELASAFNQGLSDMFASGDVDEIMERHGFE